MANSLLDFVMSLVRDPDAAARYAADPAGSIAAAHLTDVTSVDVNNLIPMVADSLSTAVPSFGADPTADGNVWASGAATAAFDAFDAAAPAMTPNSHPVDTGVIQPPADDGPAVVADTGGDHSVVEPVSVDPSTQFTDPAADQHLDPGHTPDWLADAGWDHSHIDDSHPGPDHQGFDLF
ncbi:IniB N-terminal domain-containing protein [Mycobacterium sp. DL592]|uniref:Rv0340 family IniB-related protein n=1 Tax=Mycobacterium sp. DL592 TaxID=2675524 RepID=UPI001421BE61|nr:IniB N-terminal domain-containing protein [Mycobacterium sp. DL592]